MLRMYSNGIGCGTGHSAQAMQAGGQMGRIVQMPQLYPQGGPGLGGFAYFSGAAGRGGLGSVDSVGQYPAGAAIILTDPNTYDTNAGLFTGAQPTATMQQKIKQSIQNMGLFNPTTLTVNVAHSSYGPLTEYRSVTILGNLAVNIAPSALQQALNQAIQSAGLTSYDVTAQTVNGSGGTAQVPQPAGNASTILFYGSTGNAVQPIDQMDDPSGGTLFVFDDNSSVLIQKNGSVYAYDGEGNELSSSPSSDGSVIQFGDGSFMTIGAAPAGTPTGGGSILNQIASTFGLHPVTNTNPAGTPPKPGNKDIGQQVSDFFSSIGAGFGLGALGTVALFGIGYLVVTNLGGRRR